MQSRKIRWSRLTILVAGMLGALLLCGIVGSVLAPNLRRIIQAPFWNTDAQRAAQAAHKRFDYDLPPDYQEFKVLIMGGEDAAVIIAHRERPEDLIFMEGVLEGTIANDEWRAKAEIGLAREMGGRRYDTQTVGTQDAVVRGQSTTLRILEGTDENGRKVRQAVCGFSSKSGDILLAIVAGQDTWDEAMVDSFLQSIR